MKPMGHCSGCAHWSRERDAISGLPTLRTDEGHCLLARYDLGSNPDSLAHAVGSDESVGQSHDAYLVTHADFGCVQFEAGA